MKNKTYSTFLTAIALVLLLGAGSAFGQTLVNQASGTITNGGLIKFLDDADAEFQNEATHDFDYTVDASGTITFEGIPDDAVFTGTLNPLGDVAADRIPGWVVYSGNNNMTIYGNGGNAYYSNLILEDGTGGTHTKTFLNGFETHVSGIYFATGADRDYLGCDEHSFYYDGTNQTIFPESGLSSPLNTYADLHLEVDALIGTSGNKTVNDGDIVRVKYGLFSTNSATLTVLGDMAIGTIGAPCTAGDIQGDLVLGLGGTDGTFQTGDLDNSFSGAVSINTTGSLFDVAGNADGDQTFVGIVAINSGSFSLSDIADVDFNGAVDVATGGNLMSTDGASGDININNSLDFADGGILYLGDGNELNISGPITNADGNCDNLTFQDNSTVSYLANNSAVLASIPGGSVSNKHDYANLIVTGGGTATVQSACSNTVYVREDFTLGTTGTPTDFNVVGSAVIMTDGIASYEGQSEVIGEFGRFAYAMNTSLTYTFNNSDTEVGFGSLPASPTDDIYFSLNIRPDLGGTPYGAAPRLKIDDPTGMTPAVYDVERKITPFASNDEFAASFLRIAYDPSEYDYSNGTPTRLKMVEGYATDQRGDKIVTGYSFNKNTDELGWDWVSIQGENDNPNNKYLIAFDNTLTAGDPDDVYTINVNSTGGSDIVLTDEIMPIISVDNGRWTDPLTWDEGRRPNSQDYVLVRHIVYTGDDNQLFGASRAWGIEENDPSADLNDAGTIEFVGGNNKVPIMAANVQLDTYDAGTTGDQIALYVGNTDNDIDGIGSGLDGATLVFGNSTLLPTEHGLFNNNTFTQSWNLATDGTSTGLQGIYVTAPSAITPIIRGTKIDNEGAITNYSTIEIGQ